MPRKKTVQPIHSSFAFTKKDIILLKYCAEKTGLSQSELIRTLIRICASGKRLPRIVSFAPHPNAKKWLKDA